MIIIKQHCKIIFSTFKDGQIHTNDRKIFQRVCKNFNVKVLKSVPIGKYKLEGKTIKLC